MRRRKWIAAATLVAVLVGVGIALWPTRGSLGQSCGLALAAVGSSDVPTPSETPPQALTDALNRDQGTLADAQSAQSQQDNANANAQAQSDSAAGIADQAAQAHSDADSAASDVEADKSSIEADQSNIDVNNQNIKIDKEPPADPAGLASDQQELAKDGAVALLRVGA